MFLLFSLCDPTPADGIVPLLYPLGRPLFSVLLWDDRAKSDRQEKSADNNQSGLESFFSTGFGFGAVGIEVIFPAEKIVLSLSLSHLVT